MTTMSQGRHLKDQWVQKACFVKGADNGRERMRYWKYMVAKAWVNEFALSKSRIDQVRSKESNYWARAASIDLISK